MALDPVRNPLTAALGTVGRPLQGNAPGSAGGVRPSTAQPGAGGIRPQPPAAAPAALRPTQPLAAPSQALPAEPPPGTDPALWSVLTSEERTYFAKAAATGPLTYGRISAGVQALNGTPLPTPTASMLGGRLDVRA